MSQGYFYNTPNDGLRVVAVDQAWHGRFGVFFVDWSGVRVRVNTHLLPMCASAVEAQQHLDAWAAKRGLKVVEVPA